MKSGNQQMRLYAYIITHDTGFAPNPFWRMCTLSNCKPVIRRTAKVGDWIAGLTPKSEGHKLIYAMQVEEKLTHADYFRDTRFAAKIPDYNKGQPVFNCGDNIYKPLENGEYQQLQSRHSSGLDENPKNKDKDLRGRFVLISGTFYYFGSQAIGIPEELSELKEVGRGHKNSFPIHIIQTFLEFISNHPEGINAPPSKWPSDDESWRTDHL